MQEKEGLFTFAGQQAAVTIHNSFLTVLAENGVTGEAAFLFLCLKSSRFWSPFAAIQTSVSSTAWCWLGASRFWSCR